MESCGSVDPAFEALLSDPRFAVRPPREGQSLQVYRDALNGFMARDLGPVMASVEDTQIAGPAGPIRVRRYVPYGGSSGHAIVFLHGGGFVFGSLDSHDGQCRRLAQASGCEVFACDYRLAPEHPSPAAEEDCLAVLRFVHAEKIIENKSISVVGDSAGGFLALSSVLGAADDGLLIDALALIYPALDPSGSSRSIADFGEGYMMTSEALRWFWSVFCPAAPELDLSQLDPRRLPPTLVLTAEFDPLRDEGRALAIEMESQRLPVSYVEEVGMIHGFLGLAKLTPRAEQATRRIVDHLRKFSV